MNELNLFLKILCLVFALMPVYGFSQVSKKDSIQTETHVSKKLDEVVVKGKRQVIKYLGNKMIYYVNKDPEAKGLKFFDVLRKMPIIQVQDNDQITIQGNKSFKVLFNGKEDKVFNNNLKEFIKSIPADEIDRFEVIMEPDPKYTQEGYTKVLNIVTVSGGRLKGFTSTYRENMDNHQTNDASIFSCIQNRTTSVSAKIGEHHTNRAVLSKSSSYTENYVAKPLQKINESADDSKHGRNHQYNVELDATCEMDSLNLLCMSGQFDENRSKQWVNATYNMEENFSYNIERYIRNHNQNATFSTDYQHFFRKNRNASLTVSYLFNNVVDTHLQEENYWNIEGDVPTISLDTTTVGKTYFITNRIPITIKEHTFQTDFSTALKHQDVDLGVKYINRNRQQKDVFKNIEQVFKFYAGYKLSLNKWQIWPEISCDHETSKIDHYERNFNLFQPHLTLSYQIRDNLKFMIEGGYKEFSPDIYALNPFEERYSNRVKYGNPDLNNESNVGGAFSLQYFSQKIYAVVGGNVYHTGNSIELYSWTDNDGIISSTYGNIGHLGGCGIYAYIGGNLWKNTYITINPRASFNYYRCPIIGIDHKKLALQYTFTLQQKMPLGLSLYLMIDGSTSDIGMMTKTSGYLDHSFSLYRNFLKNDTLSVGLIFNDPFKKYHETETETLSSNYYSQEKRRNDVQFFGIDINYHFGKLQNAVKKTKKSIINNDVKVL